MRHENALLKVKLEEKEPKKEAATQGSVLDTRKVTLNFDQTPFDEVVSFLRDITGLKYMTSMGLDGTVGITLRLRNVSLRSVLDLLAAKLYDSVRGTVIWTWDAKTKAVRFEIKKKE